MLLKEDFDRQIRDTISAYPDVALQYQAGDPRVLAQLGATAAMFGMMSQQLELCSMEPFEKVRDATVLADAALKGILPMGTPALARITVQNPTSGSYTLAAGRRVLDASGKYWTVQSAAVIAAGQTGTASVLQRTVRDEIVTIPASTPFLAVEVPPGEDDKFIAGLSVKRNSDNLLFTYKTGFVNTLPGDTVYHVETDEYRRLYVRFGFDDVVGYQPGAGAQFTFSVNECDGDVRPDNGSPFSLEYILSPADSAVILKMDQLLEPGAAPISIATLRELTKYPSVYNDDAVFLGEFDLLVRKSIPNLAFLSIWNEQLEERVRGPNIDNVNTLFVAVLPPAGGDLTATQDDISETILAADDSYKIKFYDVVDREIAVSVDAFVAVVNDPAVVASQIKSAIIALYGADTAAAKRGMLVVQNKAISDTLRAKVPALADAVSDLKVSIDAALPSLLPEHRQFVSDASLTVNVFPVRENIGNWGR